MTARTFTRPDGAIVTVGGPAKLEWSVRHDPASYEVPSAGTRRHRCQFTVNGSYIVGVVYVTVHTLTDAYAITRAARIAAKRSGDPNPVFVRFA